MDDLRVCIPFPYLGEPLPLEQSIAAGSSPPIALLGVLSFLAAFSFFALLVRVELGAVQDAPDDIFEQLDCGLGG